MGESIGDPDDRDRELRLHQVLATETLQNGNQKQRSEGLKALKNIFDRSHKASNLDKLADKAYHTIYEVLFKIAVSEKQTFLASKKNTQTAALNRLTACADVIRTVVNASASKLKGKTVEAIVDHIIQTLPRPDGGYYEPLAQHYLKALSGVFEHRPTVEQLKTDRWLEIIDFCLQGLNQYLDISDDEPLGLSRSFSGLASGSMYRPASGNGYHATQLGALTKQNIEDLLQMLSSLVCVCNAPLSLRYDTVATSTIRFLQLQGSSIGQVHQLAFSIINSVLKYARTDHTSFSLTISQDAIPIISRFWQGKSVAKDEMLNSVRDEMLIFLFQVHAHLEFGVKNEDTADMSTKLEDLADVLKADYVKRSDRDQLQLDDLDMLDIGAKVVNSHPFHLPTFRLRPHIPRGERNWAHLQIIGIVERLLRVACEGKNPDAKDDVDADKHPRKRQRFTQSSDRMTNLLRSEDEKTRMSGLHALPFLLEGCQLSVHELWMLLTHLNLCVSDKRGNIASWALLCVSCCTNQRNAEHMESNVWMQLWHAGTRCLTLSVTCRAASVQLHAMLANKLVQYHDIGEDINAMVAASETNGPAILCDSAIFLMAHLLHTRVTQVPGTSLVASQHVVRWLFAKWNPDDKVFAVQYALHVQPQSFNTLLRTCLGLPRLKAPLEVTLPCGIVAQAWQHHLNTHKTVRYLLLLDVATDSTSSPTCSSCPSYADADFDSFIIDSAYFQAARRLILELLSAKSSGILKSWKSYTMDRSAPISTDVYRSAVYSLVTLLLSMSYFLDTSSPHLADLKTNIQALSEDLVNFLADVESRDMSEAQSFSRTLLQALQPHFPRHSADNVALFRTHEPELLRFLLFVAEDCSKRRLTLSSASAGDVDLMDVDDDFSTQRSSSKEASQMTLIPRLNLALERDPATFYLTIAGRLELLAGFDASPEMTGYLPPNFINYLELLSDEEFVLSRQLISTILDLDFALESDDASRLLNRVGILLSSTEFSRCEVALGVCLDVLICLAPLWSNPDTDSTVAEPASQIYQWFIDVALSRNIASSEIQKLIAQLLYLLLRIEPEYGVSLSIPSARSSLFNLLQKSDVSVRFHIGNDIPEVFGHFVLKDHDTVFVDVLESLPSDRDWTEGISFRLFVLSRLASRWSNLLRRCIYHIFETPGRIRLAIPHATRCLKDVASALDVEGPREVFSLFAPQLLFTWLDSDAIEDIPFEIFGFSSLRDLIQDAQDEFLGLTIMRGNEAQFDKISKILKIDQSTLLQSSFTKVLAYSIAHDLSIPRPSNSNGKLVSSEARIKKSLGPELFFKSLNLHFADIVALTFNIMDQESNVEKYFSRKDDLVYAVSILDEIKVFGSSHVSLPPNQQPMFSAKYFSSEILHLCSRTKYEPSTLYTPALVTSIARKLLDTLHPALGSLHKCSVLRKLRILISLAGDSTLYGYPLEMFLQSVRQFLIDPECTDDAIGILKYLLSRGFSYLSTQPSFVAGLGLSIYGSLRTFLKSSQSSTTQESQFRATMSTAQDFREWLGRYFDKYESPSLKTQSKSSFKSLLRCALDAQSTGNADKGSSESRLLFFLLKDERDGGALLSKSSRALALSTLCSEFRLPRSFRNDFLGADESSVANAAVIWRSCRTKSASREYLCWAGRVLGRAFASSGYIHDELLQESSLKILRGPSGIVEGERDSQSSILHILQDLTLDDNPRNVGLGECALRFILSTTNESLIEACDEHLAEPLRIASTWSPYHTPPSDDFIAVSGPVTRVDQLESDAILQKDWLRDFSIGLAQSVPGDYLLLALVPVLRKIQGFADILFPFILHLTLLAQLPNNHYSRTRISKAFVEWLGKSEAIYPHNLKMLLNALLYLRTQPIPNEKSSADRSRWLDINYLTAAVAATRCGMHKTALLFIEELRTELPKSSRRSSTAAEPETVPNDILLTIFQNIDDPDMYYGVQQQASLSSILTRFEYEKDGPKSLAFRGAQYDSHIRRGSSETSQDLQSLVKALDVLSLSGVSHSLLQAQQSIGMTSSSLDSMFQTARKLEQWDIPVPPSHSSSLVTIYKAFQMVHTSIERATINLALNEGFESTTRTLVNEDLNATALHTTLQTLAALTEMDEVMSSQGSEEFEDMLARFHSRAEWMRTGTFDDISQILSCRGTTLSTLSRHPKLQKIMNVPAIDTRVVEVRAALLASKLNRAHNALQGSLSLATSMMDLVDPCLELGIKVGVSVSMDAANTLWDQGEMASSIGMLQALDDGDVLKEQTIVVGRSNLLSRIGYQVSVARFEKADKVIDRYLKPALKELRGNTAGSEAGEVFHQFAVFCDQQLQDPDSLEDLERLKKLRRNKASEVEEYGKLMAKSDSASSDKARYRSYQKKAQTWLKLDEEELRRLNASRDEFLRQCLENYLLALSASDDHDRNALRFTALWLEYSESRLANDAVLKHLQKVPSRKLAPLANQLTSRLQDNDSQFQQLLYALVLRICKEHPYHCMYQIYAGAKSKPNSKDETASSRLRSATRLSKEFQSLEGVSQIWSCISATNSGYTSLASEKDDRYRSGKKVPFQSSNAALRLASLASKHKAPPPTMQIPLAPNMDYAKVPKMHKFEAFMSIASGVSAPKIITAIADDGTRFKQLVKGGNDDLRQDAIMEQVFEQVSELLKTNRSTRQRNLSIRTYRVLPLTSTAGVIEFVANTIPLHDYLMPAHERYHPRDLKGPQCRKEIAEVQSQSVEVRLKRFRSVTERFQPVMRYFFTERFTDPNEWFAKRLAYTRSTAAISILGHVLGLGDRHGHNILLDAKSGEVVHIDLGVAFEMGRVLPVPELVPFRLTRDTVDGMGITRTEGVFRRCCEFTLEALRKEAYSIMTILDVLRFDPLYMWSISPVRLAKLQEEQSAAPQVADAGAVAEKAKGSVNEPGEADRALTVVNKKLSKTLSVTATVNDLINQAIDERNLAVLYSGWAAYA